jgi:hypothetical protein
LPAPVEEELYYIARGQSALHPAIALKVIRELNHPSDLPPTTDPLTARELLATS